MSRNTLIGILAVVVLVGVGAVALTQNGNNESQDQSEPQDQQQTGNFGEAVSYQITGIDPGAGIMENTEAALDAYGLGDAGWNLQESSSAAMLAAVQDAISNEEPIIATVWEPHSVFSVADIRKLDDPQNIYNSPSTTRAFLEEHAPQWADAEVQSDVIASLIYSGFADDAPAAAAFLENFNVSADTQSEWTYRYSVEDETASSVAASFIAENQSQVDEWMPADDVALGKDTITVGIPPWPGATVKSRVVASLLEDIGYETEIQEVDPGVLYTSLADEQIDVNLAGWLPTTHQSYWDEHGDNLEIAGINVTMTWLGLGVPSYVDESVQSIEDLRDM
jgi:glycine betaine/proline transport system substrate-binding protein